MNDNPFSNALATILAVTGFFIGVGAGAEDPELNAFFAGITGAIMGVIAGKIIGVVLS